MKKLAILLAVAALGSAANAYALTKTTTLPVTATVVPAVTVAAAPMNFGNIIAGEGTDATSTILVTATTGLPYTIGLDAGQNHNLGDRAVRSANGDVIPYQLFSDVSHSSAWGDGGATTTGSTVAGSGLGAQQMYQVYGHLKTLQNHPAGVYSDTVAVTVTY